MKTTDFEKEYPHPDQVGIDTLYKFTSFNQEQLDRTSHLFVSGKLYHSTPDKFNDPFECKPHWKWPSNPNDIRAIRKHLIKVAIKDGSSRKNAEKLVSDFMKNSANVKTSISGATLSTFSRLRICCFTTDYKHLLFWSHYTNSHKGFCVGFNANVMPISYAFKVRYQDQYPEIKYPEPIPEKRFEPALIKSKDWEYEQEYRTILAPDAKDQPNNDGESIVLEGHEMNSVGFPKKIDRLRDVP